MPFMKHFKLMNAIFKQVLPENVNKQQFSNSLIYILFRYSSLNFERIIITFT